MIINSSSLSQIKTELQNLNAKDLQQICLRLARYKKENKELLAFLLFEAENIEDYTSRVRKYMDESFKELNTSNLYFAKKTLRKILRQSNKYIKYTSSKQTEVEVLIYFCSLLKATGIVSERNKMLYNMYMQQMKKIRTALAALHEDIQYDFLKQLERL